MNVAIYGLCDPATGRIRYVGRSTQPQERLRQHLREARDERRGYRKCRWIRSLAAAPTLRILDWVAPDDAVRAEGYWIRRLTRGGCRLVNTGTETHGLWSVAAWTAPRPPKTPEHLAAISAALKGRKNGPMSEEAKAHLSAYWKGKRKSPETIERMRRARQGTGGANARLVEAEVRMIRAEVADGDARKAAAQKYGVSYQTVTDIVLRRRWKHVR